MKPPEGIKRDFVAQWIRSADADLAAARYLLSGGTEVVRGAVFHAQQAAEKFLKAGLVWHQVEFPKTHDIGRLADLLETVDADLAARVREASALTPYAVEALGTRVTFRSQPLTRRARPLRLQFAFAMLSSGSSHLPLEQTRAKLNHERAGAGTCERKGDDDDTPQMKAEAHPPAKGVSQGPARSRCAAAFQAAGRGFKSLRARHLCYGGRRGATGCGRSAGARDTRPATTRS